MARTERKSFGLRQSESTEELEKEENGLLGGSTESLTRTGEEKELTMIPSTNVPSTNVPSGKTLQIFSLGFVTNLLFVSLALLLFHRNLNVSESDTATFQPQISSIQAPLFLNDTTSFGFLLDANGGFKYSGDYFLLQQGFEAQVNQAYCGVATVTTVLNSFRSQLPNLPVDYEYDPYAYATQDDVLDDCATKHVILHDEDFDGIFAFPYGLGMSQMSALAKCFFSANEYWEVKEAHLDPSQVSLDQMRSNLIDYLKDTNARVMVNFQRSVVHESGGGHWSPVGSYSAEIDAFLLLDVAKYKFPATWVPANMLYHAMVTTDSCGLWDFPLGQNKLSDDLLYPESADSYAQAAKELGCQETFRGYVGVRQMV